MHVQTEFFPRVMQASSMGVRSNFGLIRQLWIGQTDMSGFQQMQCRGDWKCSSFFLTLYYNG